MTETKKNQPLTDPLSNPITKKSHLQESLKKRFLEGQTANTKATYEKCLRSFFKSKKVILLNAIEPRHVRDYLFKTLEDKSRNYLALQKSALSSFFDFLIVEGVLKTNPARPVKLPKPDKKKFFYDVPTENEIYRILDSFKNQDYTVLSEFLYLTGLRVSEALGLKITDFKEESAEMLSATFIGKGGRTGKVKVSKELFKKLQILSEKSEKKFIFSSPRDPFKPLEQRTFLAAFKIALKKSKVQKNVTPHKLRHANAVEAMKNGATLIEVKNNHRHESIKSTSVYLEAFKSEREISTLLENKVRDLSEVG